MVRRLSASRLRKLKLAPALALNEVRFGHITGLNLSVAPGECVVLQDLNNHILHDLIALLSGECAPESGAISVDGQPLGWTDTGTSPLFNSSQQRRCCFRI